MALRIARAELAVATARLDAVAGFYEQALGFAVERHDGRVVIPVGDDVLELVATGDGTDPFHHFALLVPGDRFDAARAWLGERAETLARDDGETVFPFDFWDARAVYFHDPAGNIVELIAHAGTAERGATGDFSAAELAGLSEVGIVVDDTAAAVAALERERGARAVVRQRGAARVRRRQGAHADPRAARPGLAADRAPRRAPRRHGHRHAAGTAGAVVLAGSPERSVRRSG